MRTAGGVVEAHLRTRRARSCCRECAEAWRSRLCTRYRGHPAGVVVYNCWPPLPYHHPHFSGPPSSSSHPLHYPGDPYYVNSVASETSVRSADKSSGCWLLLDPPHSWSWRDRSNTENSGHLSRWGGRRFRTTVQRWIDTIFGGWHYFFWLPAAVDRR